MIIVAYALGLCTYVLSVVVSYAAKFKLSAIYFPTGLALALIANFLWLWIARYTQVKSDLYVRGLIWDSMIVGCYALLPVLFFGVRLSGCAVLGALFVIFGLILLKL